MRKPAKRLFRLMAWWNPKEQDLYVEVTPRATSADMHWLAGLLNRDVTKELESRGYDLSTLRFSIDKTPAAVDEHFSRYPNSAYREEWETKEKA